MPKVHRFEKGGRDGRLRVGHAIIMEHPEHGVIGIIACAAEDCPEVRVLRCDHVGGDCIEKHAGEMTKFLVDHRCGAPN